MKQSTTLAQMHLFEAEKLEIEAEVLEAEAKEESKPPFFKDLTNPPNIRRDIKRDLENAESNLKAARLKKEAQRLRDRAEKHRSKAAAGNRREWIERPKLERI